MSTTTKRVRHRPNMITVEMSDDVRGMLNDLLEYRSAEIGENYPASWLIRQLIRDAHDKQLKIISKNSKKMS